METTRQGPASNRVHVLIISPDGVAALKAREVGARLLGRPVEEMMQAPLSPTGAAPANHWLCENNFPVAVFAQMLAYPRQHGTEILEVGEEGTEAALAQRGLRRIKEQR